MNNFNVKKTSVTSGSKVFTQLAVLCMTVCCNEENDLNLVEREQSCTLLRVVRRHRVSDWSAETSRDTCHPMPPHAEAQHAKHNVVSK
jgi:hypothetical protein